MLGTHNLDAHHATNLFASLTGATFIFFFFFFFGRVFESNKLSHWVGHAVCEKVTLAKYKCMGYMSTQL
jgi:hypothetical protein